jgi:hypothetical protein
MVTSFPALATGSEFTVMYELAEVVCPHNPLIYTVYCVLVVGDTVMLGAVEVNPGGFDCQLYV